MNYVINIPYTILIPTFYTDLLPIFISLLWKMGLERTWFSVTWWLRCCISAYALSTLTQNLFFIFLIRDNILSLPRVNISWKFIIFFKTDCQGLFDKIILLNHVNFRLLMNALRLIICKPPWQYCFTTILCFILQDLPTSIRKICCLILLVFGLLDLEWYKQMV